MIEIIIKGKTFKIKETIDKEVNIKNKPIFITESKWNKEQENLSYKVFKIGDKYITIQVQKESKFKNETAIHIWSEEIDKEYLFNFPILPELFSDLFIIFKKIQFSVF